MIHNPPTIIAQSPVLDGYNSTFSVYEFPLPPPTPGTPSKQSSTCAISSRTLMRKHGRQPGDRLNHQTLGVDWDAASDWSWEAESCISPRLGHTLRGRASNNSLSVPAERKPIIRETKSSAAIFTRRYPEMLPLPVSAPAAKTAETPSTSLFASASMPETFLGKRSSFLHMDDDPLPPPVNTRRETCMYQGTPSHRGGIIASANLIPSMSMPEMSGGILSMVEDAFPSESISPDSQRTPRHNGHLRPNFVRPDPIQRCSAFDRLEISIAKLKMHDPNRLHVQEQTPVSAHNAPTDKIQFHAKSPDLRKKASDRHTYSPASAHTNKLPSHAIGSQQRRPDPDALSRAHKSRWRDAPLPVVPPRFETMLRNAESQERFGASGTLPPPSRSSSSPSSPLASPVWSPPPGPSVLLPSPVLTSSKAPIVPSALSARYTLASSHGTFKPPLGPKPARFVVQSPSVPPVLTSFMNMSPEPRLPPDPKERRDRSNKLTRLLRKASVSGWWRKKGKHVSEVAQ